ncbi:MAG: sortase [Alphaproteobacteria bacterium]|nr:sortase [Alphaproteobacteria bacterium]
MRVRALAYVLAAAGIAASIAGFWIPLKAQLAYGLMDRAFEESTESDAPAKPWSWADFGVIGKLEIEGESVHILDRATGQSLAFGAGLHEEYGVPADPIVLSGHRDTHFKALKGVKAGTLIPLLDMQGKAIYRVKETRIFDMREGTLALPPKGHLLLITCWPFDGIDPGTTKRFLVLAEKLDS